MPGDSDQSQHADRHQASVVMMPGPARVGRTGGHRHQRESQAGGHQHRDGRCGDRGDGHPPTPQLAHQRGQGTSDDQRQTGSHIDRGGGPAGVGRRHQSHTDRSDHRPHQPMGDGTQHSAQGEHRERRRQRRDELRYHQTDQGEQQRRAARPSGGPPHQWNGGHRRHQRIAGQQSAHRRLADAQVLGDRRKSTDGHDLGRHVDEGRRRQHGQREDDPGRPRTRARRGRDIHRHRRSGHASRYRLPTRDIGARHPAEPV